MQLLVIAESDDNLALAFVQYCQGQGLEARRLGIKEAASVFSVETQAGVARVAPDVPIFLRACGMSAEGASFDEEFLNDEATAAVWSAAALTQRAVINRPTHDGYFAKLSSVASVSEHRAGAPRRSELFASSLVKSEELKGWWAANTSTGNCYVCGSPGTDLNVPHRLRPGVDQPGYEQVIVVGKDAWRASSAPTAHLALEGESVRYARNLGLPFSCMTWIVSHDLASATLASVDPWPQLSSGAIAWDRVFKALAKELLR